MKKILTAVLFVGFLIVSYSMVEAASYYVADDVGDDSRTTTQAQSTSTPWKTIQKAADNVTAGDTVYVKGGLTYSGTGSSDCGGTGNSAVVCISSSGTSGNYITFTSWADTGIPTIDASGNSYGIASVDQDYIEISGFQVENADVTPKAGIYYENSSTSGNGIISNNIVRNTNIGIYLYYSSDNQIYNNTLYDNYVAGFHADGDASITGIIIKNNIAVGSSFFGGFSISSSISHTSDNNNAWDNLADNYSNITQGANDISQDPLFVDAENGDFTLQSTSPSINTGADLSGTVDDDILGYNRSRGGAYDMGAYEDLNIYIAGDTGDDTTGDGSANNPWATIQKGADNAYYGDTIHVKGGLTYSDDVACSIAASEHAVVCPVNSGTSDDYITYQAWSGTGIPEIDVSAVSGVSLGFGVKVDGIAINGFSIKNAATGNNPRAIYARKSIDVTNNLRISNNIMKDSYAGVYVHKGNNVEILNNTVVDTDGTIAGGISVVLTDDYDVRNNILTNNEVAFIIYGGDGSADYNLLYNNTTDYLSNSAGEHNISQDPQFVDEAGDDFRLMANSPAIDAGADTTSIISTDIIGRSRLLEGGVDLGAYENITQYYVAGDTGSDSNLGIESAPFQTIQAAADVVLAGGTVNVKGDLTYSDSNDCYSLSNETAVVCIMSSGTENNYITFTAWDDTGIPIIDTLGVVGNGFGTEDIYGQSYFIINGFEITNSTSNLGGNNAALIRVSGLSASNVLLTNNIVYGSSAAQDGIGIFSSGDNISILNNTISMNNDDGIQVTPLSSSLGLTIKNNILTSNVVGVNQVISGGTVSLANNLFWNNSSADTSGYVGLGETDLTDQDPQFLDESSNDFRLQSTSPAIDAGTTISEVTNDIIAMSRPQYSAYDIGAYEYYEVPVSLSTSQPSWSNVSSFSWQGSVNTVLSGATMNSVEYSIDNGSWTSSGVTAADGIFDEADESFTIDFSQDFDDGYHDIRIRGLDSESTYTLTSLYGSDTFGIDTTDPGAIGVASFQGNTNDQQSPSFEFSKASDALSGIYSYKVELDPGKEYGFSVDGIPANGNREENNVAIDTDQVRVTFINEHDDDPNNDKIKVYFKELQKNYLTEGKHTWKVTIRDNAGNEIVKEAHFYIDTTNPYLDENMAVYQTTRQLRGRAIDLYSSSSYFDKSGTKYELEKVSSGPRKVLITFLQNGIEKHQQEYYIEDRDIQVYTEDSQPKYKYSDVVIDLDQMPAGKYQLQVVVVDDATNQSEVLEYTIHYSLIENLSNRVTGAVGSLKKLGEGILGMDDNVSEVDQEEKGSTLDDEQDASPQAQNSKTKGLFNKFSFGLLVFVMSVLLLIFFKRKKKKEKRAR